MRPDRRRWLPALAIGAAIALSPPAAAVANAPADVAKAHGVASPAPVPPDTISAGPSREPREPLWTDATVAVATAIAALATIVLTSATIVLAVFTYRLWKATKEAVGDTAAALDLSRKQFILMGRQTDIIEKNHAVDRLNYLATHRPKIILHAVEFISVPTEDGDGLSTIGASILCFNIGTNRAKRAEARGEILVTNAPLVDVQRHLVREFDDVHGGTKLRFSIVSERGLDDISRSGPPAVCIGTIAYWDETDVRRETGFCFVLRLGSTMPQWIGADSPEHEYAY